MFVPFRGARSKGRVVTVPVGRGRFLEGLVERRDENSSCAAVLVRVGDGAGVDVGWMRAAGANEAILCSVALESPGVAFGGVASSVNHMGWYHLRTRVTRMRWRVCRCIWGFLMSFHTRCGA